MHFHQPERFEARVLRSIVGGAVAGLAHAVLAAFATAYPLPFALTLFPAPDGGTLLPFAGVAMAGATAAAWPGAHKSRALATLATLAAVALSILLGLHPSWRLGLVAAAVGAFFIRADHAEARSAWTGRLDAGALRVALSAIALALALVAGTRIGQLLGIAALGWETPAILIALLGGAVMGLFFGLGTVLTQVTPAQDAVEAALERARPGLSGELAEGVHRALQRYRQCARILAQLPPEPIREELARTLARTAEEVAALAGQWSELERLTSEVRVESLDSQITLLKTRAAAMTDLLARRQLETAAQALHEGRERASLFAQQRERVHAKLEASVAFLECARLALLGTHGGETQLKAAELAGVSERLQALVAAQGEDARWVDALATGAELSAMESRVRV